MVCSASTACSWLVNPAGRCSSLSIQVQPMPSRERGAATLLALFLCQGLSVLPSIAKPALRVGAIPDQNPERLNRLYGQLADELSERLKVTVRYVPVSNYPATVSAFRTGGLDLVWFGGLTGVQARLQTPGAKVLAQRDIDARFRSVFIANTAADLQPIQSINGLTSLRGKRFTFGSESSSLTVIPSISGSRVHPVSSVGVGQASVAVMTPLSRWCKAGPIRQVP